MALDNDLVYHDHKIVLEIGRVKNRNKNPAAERAVQELELELLRRDPHGGPLSCCNLCRKRNPELTNSLSWIVSS